LRGISSNAQRQQTAQRVAAHEGGAFDARVQTLIQTLDTLAASGQLAGAADPLLREQLLRLQAGFRTLTGALEPGLQPLAQAEAQSAEYRAFAQSLRDMAALEATMQSVAESGQQVLHRLTQGRQVAHEG
jgi:hypothetical protein